MHQTAAASTTKDRYSSIHQKALLVFVTWYHGLLCTSELVSAALAISRLHILPAGIPTGLSCRKLQCEATVTAKVFTCVYILLCIYIAVYIYSCVYTAFIYVYSNIHISVYIYICCIHSNISGELSITTPKGPGWGGSR